MKRNVLRNRHHIGGLIALAAAVGFSAVAWGAKPPAPGQASITLLNCGSALCNFNNTAWTLSKTPDSQSVTVPGTQTITWEVTATKGATSANTITVNGTVTVKNTGSAKATIGNIVVNLQKPRTGGNTGACKNVPWVSAAADVADATNGDGASSANIVAAASQEDAACNASQGTSNYTSSGFAGTFKETLGSGSLEFTDASDNTVFSLVPELKLDPGESITLLYTAKFNATLLGLPAGTPVRAEAIVTFGNSGERSGSGNTATNIDIDGDGIVNTTDEVNVRSVPCRVTSTVPTLFAGNAEVTLSDTNDDVSVVGANVIKSLFQTTIGGGTGTETIAATTDPARSVSIDETCTAPGAASITNTAYLDGTGLSVTVQGAQTGQVCTTDPVTFVTTCKPVYAQYTFECVAGVNLDDSANASVSCEGSTDPDPPYETGDYCTYTQGKYNDNANSAGANYLQTNFSSLNFSPAGGLGLLRIGVEAADPNHDAEWTDVNAFREWIGGGGSSGALTADTEDATSTSGGTLAKQTAAMTVNLALSGVMPDDPAGLGALKMCNVVAGTVLGHTFTAAQATALNGKSIADIVADANAALGGNGLPPYVASFGDLNGLLDALNQSFDECVPKDTANLYLCKP